MMAKVVRKKAIASWASPSKESWEKQNIWNMQSTEYLSGMHKSTVNSRWTRATILVLKESKCIRSLCVWRIKHLRLKHFSSMCNWPKACFSPQWCFPPSPRTKFPVVRRSMYTYTDGPAPLILIKTKPIFSVSSLTWLDLIDDSQLGLPDPWTIFLPKWNLFSVCSDVTKWQVVWKHGRHYCNEWGIAVG